MESVDRRKYTEWNNVRNPNGCTVRNTERNNVRNTEWDNERNLNGCTVRNTERNNVRNTERNNVRNLNGCTQLWMDGNKEKLLKPQCTEMYI